ncbi:uncharacterized protein LOC130369694 isoform X2 [Gadus chalcogrammus]|uniref:uncharacterized protein LOC130369694 isoform X2 n=1 Tax=Gadus chalcogrammus TaxID=1042646 RepID=UPI0024C4BA86|nr:uncharacterized protein LOC130369694 isoform X2 [Gadus chalcogrammus]
MSRDLYYPHSPESPDSPQHPYQPASAHVGPGNVGDPSHMVPGSTHASYGVYAGTSMNPSHMYPSMHPGSMGYIPVQSKPTTELESSIDVHITRTRQEAGLQSIIKMPAPDQNNHTTAWPLGSLDLAPAGYRSSPPIFDGQFARYSEMMPNGAPNWHWPSGQQTSNYHSTSFPPTATNVPQSHYSQSSERYPVSRYSSADEYVSNNRSPTAGADSAPSPRSSLAYEHPSTSREADNNQTRFTCESAMDILQRFDLQEEDLEDLCAYSEDQLSPANLPYLLRDIRKKKAKNSSAASQSSTGHQAQGSQRAPETRAVSGAEVKREAQAPPTFQQPSKVIEYGHTSTYSLGFREEEKDGGHHSSSYMSQMWDTQPMDAAPAKPSAPLFSNGSQRSNISSAAYSHLPNVKASLSHKPATQSIQTSIAAPKKVPIALQLAAPVAKPTATNIIPKRDSDADRMASSGCRKAAFGAGNTSQRPAPATDPGPVSIPRSIPTNQGPPPASDESIRRPPPVKPADERVPTAAMISDYMGVKPELFPYTCSLCTKPCFGMKGWLEHRIHIVHLARCRLLRRQYSEWEPDSVSLEYSEWEQDTVSLDSAPEESQQPPTTTAVPASSPSSPHHPTPFAPSNSAPPLPRRILEALASWTPPKRSRSKSSGRKGSRSPRPKRSRSPRKKRSRSPRRKRSTSPASLRSPDWKRTSGKASSPCSSRPIHSRRSRSRSSSSSSPSSDRCRGKRQAARRSRRSSGSPRRGRGSRSPRHARGTRPNRRSRSGSRSPHPSSQRRRSRSHDGRSSGRRQEETSVEQLAKKLLESSGVQSFTGSSSLELVVQSLAPVLLAELAKLKAASSSSSDSSKEKKPSSSSSSRDEQKQSSSSSRDEKKPSSSSSSRDEQKQSSSSSSDKKKPSSSRDEQKPSSSSSREKKPSSSSSSRDEQKPSSSSSKDERKPSSSSSRDEQKPSSSSSRDEKKPSSSSSSSDKQKQASTSSTKGGNEPPSSSSSVKGIKKVLVKKSVPTKSAKPPGSGLLGFVPAHPPLLLSGLPSKVTPQQVFCALEKFGKSRLISVAGQEATVYFRQEAAAHALLGFTELKIGGNPITVTQIAVPGTTTVPHLLPTPGSSVQVQSSATMAVNVVAELPSSSMQCNKTTAPGIKTTAPGTKGTTPGNKKATPGNATTTPGSKTTTPGKKTTMHANKMSTPSKSTTTPDNKVTTPGNKAATPGKKPALPGTAPIIPGNETATPGNTTATFVKNTTMPSNATTLPDNKTTTPGNKTAILCKKTSMPSSTTTVPGSTTTPGNKMTPPGNKATTPGNKTATPSNKTATPGTKMTTPGTKMTTPGNKAASPSNKTATPGSKMAPPVNVTITPGSNTTTTGNTKTMSENKVATPGNKTTVLCKKTSLPSMTTTVPGRTETPGDKTPTPGNKIATPGSTTTMPSKKKITPGNTITTPVNKTATPGDKMAPPVNVTITPGSDTTTTGNTTTMSESKTPTNGNKTPTNGNKTPTSDNITPTPDNKAIELSNNTATPGSDTTTTGNTTTISENKTTTPDNKTATPGNKMAPPVNVTITPGSDKTTTGNTTTMSESKTTTPGNKTPTSDDKTPTSNNVTPTPDIKAIELSNNTDMQGDTEVFPTVLFLESIPPILCKKTSMPSNTTTVPGSTATPGNKMATPGSDTTTTGNTSTMSENKRTTPDNKAATPLNVTITPGSDTTTTGNTTTMSENETPTSDNKTPPSDNLTPTPDNKVIELSNNKVTQGCTDVFSTVLPLESIQFLDVQCWTWNDFLLYATGGATIMVTDLPEIKYDAYPPSLITPFLGKIGNIYWDKCFILPDNCMAFLTMTANRMASLIEALVMEASLNFETVRFHILKENALESPIIFYKHLLRWSEKLYDESTLEYRLVFISNIPYCKSSMDDIFKGVLKTGGVRHYLPLIGKIFVEFVTVEDADRFSVWLSTFPLDREIHISRPGLAHDKARLEDAFLMTVFTQTVFYPTLSPQFYTPAHRTVNGPEDLEWAETNLTTQSVMVTGLAFGTYRHMDLVDEVWPYFVEKDISRVYYSVVILPLQRRAFIHFDDALKCKEFVSDFLHKPFTMGGSDLTLHFLVNHLKPCTSELQLYYRMLHLSNVVSKGTGHQEQLILKEMDHCNMKVLRDIFDHLSKKTHLKWLSCLVLANRVVFRLIGGRPDINKRTRVLNKLNGKKGKTQGQYGTNREVVDKVWKSVSDFTSSIQNIDVRTVINSPQHAKSGQSPPDPSAPGPSGPGPYLQREVSMELDKTTSSSTSTGLESNSSTTAHSSSLSGATVSSSLHLHKSSSSSSDLHKSSSSSDLPKSSSSSSDLPKSSSSSTSSSLPLPVGVVPSSSEQNTQQKCEESSAQVSEAVDTTHTPSRTSQEGTLITTTEEAESLVPACPAIRRKEELSEAAMVCEDDMARFGHMMAAETSAVKSAASLTGKDVLHTDPCLEEEGKRKAQQELTLTGKDVVVSPSEDMKENRVEVDETQEQLGDEKSSDQMLHSRPECGEETPHQTPVQPETPGLPDPQSQTSEPQEEEMLAKVADEAEPFQEVQEHKETILEEGKVTIVEEQMPSVNEETPSVVSEAADALLNDASTEEGDINRLMDCVEGSPPKEEEQKTKQTQEEEQKSKETQEEEQMTKEPPEEEQGKKEQSNEAPTEGADNKGPAVEAGAPELDQRQSKRGHPSPVPPATTPLSTRRSTRHSTPTKKRESPAEEPVEKAVSVEMEAVFEVLDSIGGDVVEDAPAPEQPGRPRRGLANKDPTPEKDGKVVPDDTPEGTHSKQEKVKKEQEVARQVMEEPQGDEQPAAGKRRSGRGRKEEVAVSGTSKMAAKEGQQRVKDLEEVYQVVDSVGGEEEPAPVEEQPPGLEPRRGKRGGKVAGSDSATEDEAATKMKTTEQTMQPKVNEGVGAKKAMDGRKESQEQEENALVSLDEVSEEEEDYPDDSVEEEELRKRQAGERREEEEEERKRGEGIEGLLTLDEVGEEEEEEVDEEEVGPGGEEESGRRAGGITEEELQTLVTLDEIVKEEQEGEEPTHSEPLPDDQSEARLNTETVCDEEKASSSIVGECKQSEEQAEECVSFVTLDEVGYEEEEETQPRSKRGRQATERKCTRREQQQQQPATAQPSGEESPPIPAHATSLLVGKPGAVLSVKGAEPMAESPARDSEETGSEETRLQRKSSSKVRREEEGVEPKRVRSHSPSVANDYTLPAFTPNNPLGSEHVVPGFYCNLCYVFYKNETSARKLHCSRLGHYNNLKKYYQGLQEEQSRSQSGGSTPGNAPKLL